MAAAAGIAGAAQMRIASAARLANGIVVIQW